MWYSKQTARTERTAIGGGLTRNANICKFLGASSFPRGGPPCGFLSRITGFLEGNRLQYKGYQRLESGHLFMSTTKHHRRNPASRVSLSLPKSKETMLEGYTGKHCSVAFIFIATHRKHCRIPSTVIHSRLQSYNHVLELKAAQQLSFKSLGHT